MYLALFFLGLGLAVGLLALAARRRSLGFGLAGALLAFGTPLAFQALSLWGELLWFRSLGYEARAWTELGLRIGSGVVAAVLAAAVVALLTAALGKEGRWHRRAGVLVAVLLGGTWGNENWDVVARVLGRVETALREPVFGLDTGFYLLVLPFLEALLGLLTFVVGVALTVSVLAALHQAAEGGRAPGEELEVRPDSPAILHGLAGLAVALAAERLLACLRLLHDGQGVVVGPGWTDLHVQIPALLATAAAILLAGLLPLVPGVRSRLARWTGSLRSVDDDRMRRVLAGAALLWVGALGVGLVGGGVLPALSQWLLVEPNEIAYETPYLRRSIEFTRHAFDLHQAESKQFPASPRLTRGMLEENADILEEIRLWDYRALAEVYQQFQEIRLYYEFADVDVDRYQIGDRYRQVMVSAREMEVGNLPLVSQTFVNRRFVFTHGHGITMTAVSDFTPQGLPDLLIRDLPPKAAHPSLAIERPQIYYGERTWQPVIVNSREKEFDYPSGEENVYSHYEGSGGVPLEGLWRKFLFGWKLDGTQLLVSGLSRPESRVMLHREIRERVSTVAPFLTLDADPYVVQADGGLHWIVDAYTHSRSHPYAEALPWRVAPRRRGLHAPLAGVNYLRNSVKAVVNAYDGSVDLYVFEPHDPIVRAWRRIFPGLFRDASEMPDALRAHVRYPADLLRAQGQMYAKYHMTDPGVFYNQEDLWVPATEKYAGTVREVEPYYVMWQPPDSEKAEFVLMQPFTPKGRQVMVGWIAGRCDGENYGRLLTYQFPKDRRVLGPQQVESKIDQDRFLSSQLSLWDQRGSSVLRGNLLVIPLEDTLLYVEPIYLRAETAAYPELRLVIVMHGDDLAYAETFEDALDQLIGEGGPATEAALAGALPELASEAQEAFEEHLRLLGEKRFERAAEAQRRLEEILSRMAGASAGGAAAAAP